MVLKLPLAKPSCAVSGVFGSFPVLGNIVTVYILDYFCVQLQSPHTYYHVVWSNWLIAIEFVKCITVVTINSDWQVTNIGIARGGHGRASALPSLNFALPSKPSYLKINCT